MAHVFEKKWRSQDVRLQENVDFSALLLSERVLEGLEKAGFKNPSPIQLEAIPVGKFGRDLIVQAKSGTGKTLVFVTIALEMFRRKLFRPQVLIVVPTREIATQVCSVVKAVGSSFSKLTCNSFIGGLPLFADQEKAYMTQIVVGTPGRLRQLIQLKSLPTNSIRLLVFDEADELLHSSSFKDDLEDIFSSLPDEKQIIATSATFSSKVKKVLLKYLTDPQLIRLNAKHLALLGMVHYSEVVKFCPMPVIMYRAKLAILEKILKTIKFAQCLMFCNGIQRVELLYRDVKRLGFSVAYISSAKEQSDRLKAIERLKRFKCKVLVSSDLTSRGIDAENVDLVINFDLAYTTEIYLHRVGRAGRYGSVGVAISIIDSNEVGYLRRIEKEGSFKVFKLPDPLPNDLILYPTGGEFVIDDQNSGKVDDDSEAKNSISTDSWNAFDDYYNLEKEDNMEHIQPNGISKTNGNEDNACESEFAAAEDDLEKKDLEKEINIRNIQVKDIFETNDDDTIKCGSSELAADDIERDPGKEVIRNIEVKDTFETNNDVDENAIEYASSELAAVVELHNGNTNEECEKVDNDVISHSKNKNKTSKRKNIKTSKNKNICLNIQTSDINMNSNLLLDTENKVIHSKSTACANPDFCDKNALEKQGLINSIENDAPLISEFSNMNSSLKKNDFEISVDKLIKICADKIAESPELKDAVKKLRDDSENCEQENVSKSCEMKNMIQTFLDTYKSSNIMDSTNLEGTSDNDSQIEENSSKQLITTKMINNLKSQKQAFFYKTLKKFQESKDACSSSYKNETGGKENSNERNSETDLVNGKINAVQEKLVENLASLENEMDDKETNNESNSKTEDLVNEEINTVQEKLVENSEVENQKIFSEKPTFESTPHLDDKIKQDTTKVISEKARDRPEIRNKFTLMFHEFLSESDSDDLDSIEETNEVRKETSNKIPASDSLSTDSETSSSSSSDSEDESDSDTEDSSSESSSSYSDSSSSTASSENVESDESVYRHNYSRTGRQNPSLISGSVRDQILNDRVHYDRYFQGHRCLSCGGKKKEMQRDNSHFSPAVGNPPYFIDRREISSCSRKICQTRSRREHNFEDFNVTQSPLPRKHSRCHKSRELTRNVTRQRGDQSRNVCPTHQRSSRHHHHHTLDCFLPTGHRCHPNTPGNPCKQGPLCEMWYKAFYNQWLHIQSVIN